MHNFVMTLALAGILIVGLTATPVIYAQETLGPDSTMKGPDMQRMMKMMSMMETCEKMMSSGMMSGPSPQKPNKK